MSKNEENHIDDRTANKKTMFFELANKNGPVSEPMQVSIFILFLSDLP